MPRLDEQELEAAVDAAIEQAIADRFRAIAGMEPVYLGFLDETALTLRDLWLAHPKDSWSPSGWVRFLRRQTLLLWAYKGRPLQVNEVDRLDDEYRAKRHLGFLLSCEYLSNTCPLEYLTECSAYLFLGLSLAETREFDAHLRFVASNRDHREGHGHYRDFLASADQTDNSWRTCSNPSKRGKCLCQLRELHQKACDVAFNSGTEPSITNIVRAKTDALKRRGWRHEDAASASAMYAAEFYSWFFTEKDHVDQKLARKLLAHFYQNSTVVNLLEAATKCFIASEHPDIDREVYTRHRSAT